MRQSKLIQTTVITCLLALLQPIAAYAQTCKPMSIPATTPTSQFTEHGNGTVTDTKTGLMWKRCSEGQTWNGSTCIGIVAIYTWQTALQQAQTVNGTGGFAGSKDWRVPNCKELASLVEEQCHAPAINLTVFPATSSSKDYWSSSPDAYFGDGAWDVNFDNGGVNRSAKEFNRYVRLVRDGQ